MKILIALSTLFLVLVANPGYAEAPLFQDEDIIGLEFSGELLAPSSLVSQIAQDLFAIRWSYPEIAGIHVFPPWIPGKLIVALTPEAWEDYQAGTFVELDSLNTEFGAVLIDPYVPGKYLSIDYGALYHPEVLGSIYEGVDGVRYAAPSVIGGDGNDISSEQLSTYTFKRGWGDCLSGCIYADYWVFSVNGGTVELISHYGSSVSAVGLTTIGSPHYLHEPAPNPFNPGTMIKYHLSNENWVRIEIFDLKGNRVIELLNEFTPQGNHEVFWNGVDGSGAPVASGAYYCRLVADGVSQVKKMTLLK